MTTHQISKLLSKIAKNEKKGVPVYPRGAPISFIGIPAEMTNPVITLEFSLDGVCWFELPDVSGASSFSTTRKGKFSQPYGILPSNTIIPVGNREMLEGIQFCRPVTARPEEADRVIEFYVME